MLRRYKYDFRPVREVARLIDELEIDLVHCTLQISLLVGWLGVRIAERKPKIVAALHKTVNVIRKEELFDRYLYKWLLYGCDAAICVCDQQKKFLQKRFPSLKHNGHVIHNGIDTEYFQKGTFIKQSRRLRESLGIPYEAVVILHVAAFRQEKGHTILIDSFKRIRRVYPQAYLVFAGDGPLLPSIERIAEHIGLKRYIRFVGNLSDLRPLLASSDLTVLASTAVETFSMAMLESLAMECPMVATDVGGTSEAVVPGLTGFLSPPGDAETLALEICKLISNPQKRIEMGRAGRRLVLERFTLSGMIAKTTQLLNKVIHAA